MSQMSSEDEKRLFDAWKESAGCEVAYNAAVISSNTLLRVREIWSRLRDLDLERRTIACSNKNGPARHVPLNDETYAAVKRLPLELEEDSLPSSSRIFFGGQLNSRNSSY